MMRRLDISILSTLALLAGLNSCSEKALTAQNEDIIHFRAVGEDSRAIFGTPVSNVYPTLWSGTDTSMSVVIGSSTNIYTARVVPGRDGLSADVSYTLTTGQEEASSFVFVSPKAIGNSEKSGINILVPASQKPEENSCDRNAILVWSKATRSAGQSDLGSLAFSHFTSYGHFSLLNLPDDADIFSIKLTAESGWAGNWYLVPETGEITEKNVGKEITLVTSARKDIWFSCAPVDLGGKKIKISANTSKGIYTKNVTIPPGKRFDPGRILKFAVDMAGINPEKEDKYVLTGISKITGKDKVIVTMSKGGTVWALSNDKGANEAPTAIVVTVKDKTILNPSGNMIWNISNTSSKLKFYPDGTTSKWLYSTTSNNGVRVGGSNNNNEWTIDDESGYLKNIALTRYMGVYNSQDWRTYTSIHANIAGQTLAFYVYDATDGGGSEEEDDDEDEEDDGGGGSDTPPAYGKACRGWFELPAQKDDDRDGIDDDNSDLYYSWTMRADATSKRNFSSCYSKDMMHPVWVAAPLHNCYKGSSGRNNSYQNDPNIKCTQSSSFDGYTRGHLISSSERTVSVPTNKQVFYYSNIGAQSSTGFNTGGGAWNNLESFVDGQFCADTLYQVVGCIFKDFTDAYGSTIKKKTGTNGAGKSFQVPTAWYKVLLRTKKGNSGKRVDQCSADELKCAAFILAHKANQSHKTSAQDMYSVEELERLTGLTFFVNVPNAPKGTPTASDWGL